MNWFDVLVVVAVVVGVLGGSGRGTMREGLSLGALLLSLFLTGLSYGWFADIVGTVVKDDNARYFLGFGVAMTVFSALIQGTVNATLRRRRLVFFGFIDRFVGAGLGGLEGAAGMTAVAALFVVYPVWSLAAGVMESTLGGGLVARMSFVFNLLPAEFQRALELLGAL